ncbi:MAG: molybdopterin-dependent oxidoreductase, partial [Actinomycetia bacterium]|nr:molybdopterin-dependent oxidoreductase [Actinomycetes bacterium]
PYAIENVDVEAIAVRTNNPVCGAFRGFGANQAQFAAEGSIDRLAEMVGISGWEIRRMNVAVPGSVWGPGQIMDDGIRGIIECLDAVKPHYDQAIAQGKAVGIGAGIKNSGLGNGFVEIAKAVVRFNEDGSVEVRHAWTEMGQGVHTVALQIAADLLDIDPDRISVFVDTTRDFSPGQTTGSRGTLMAAGSIEDACRAAIADGCQIGIDYDGSYTIDWTNAIEDGLENPVIHSAFGYASQIVIADKETGKIEKVVAAHDVGRAINPVLVQGQVEGSIHMGLGYALTEEFPTDDDGMPTKSTLRQLNIIRPKDMPEVEVIVVEVPQPRSPFGVKGVGEIGLVPTAGAVAGAYHAIDGTWRTRLPMDVHQPLEIGD